MMKEQVALCNMSVGHSMVEVKREDGVWGVAGQPHEPPLHAGDGICNLRPLAGHDRMKTCYDPEGRKVRGTNYNCGGGITPWATVLSCEEGASDTFGGDIKTIPHRRVLERYGYDGSDYYGRARFDPRFDVEQEPNEANRFDWVFEFDP